MLANNGATSAYAGTNVAEIRLTPQLADEEDAACPGLRFRMRNFLWASGSALPRTLDQAFSTIAPSTDSDKELMRARVGGLRAPHC